MVVGHLFGRRGRGRVLPAAGWAVAMAAPFAGNLVLERWVRREKTLHLS